MNRGPRKGSIIPQEQLSMLKKANIAFKSEVPDWIGEIASLCDTKGLKAAAKMTGYSTSAISTVINAKYQGDIERVEEAVRGALMGVKVECPVLGEIGRDRCLTEQVEPFRATSAHRAQLYHACRGECKNYRKGAK